MFPFRTVVQDKCLRKDGYIRRVVFMRLYCLLVAVRFPVQNAMSGLLLRLGKR